LACRKCSFLIKKRTNTSEIQEATTTRKQANNEMTKTHGTQQHNAA
jgi:hypothetical protein